MLPSSTVENYLKAIYTAPPASEPPSGCCRWGSSPPPSASPPGTATTMVKTLAESGLVEYQPYAGVALTPPGQKLAALVLRRHRLIELFLVRRDGVLVGRGARRSRAPRARGQRSADRSHRRDARTARDRPARRSDSERRGSGEAAGGADAPVLPARHHRHRHARHRSGQGLPALHRAATT